MMTFLLALVGSTGVANLVVFFVQRHDAKKKNPIKELVDKIDKLASESRAADEAMQRDLCRLQLQNLMDHHAEDTNSLMLVAHRYFVDLSGNWYMDAIFKVHCEKNGIVMPSWFDGGNK